MRRTLVTVALFLVLAGGCSAAMRPIPDDVEPFPPKAIAAKNLADGGATALGDASPRFIELAHAERPPACTDARHHALRVHQVASDRFIVSRAVIDVLRTERKAQISPQVDATGTIIGASIEDVGDSCLQELGFRNGDLVRSINGHIADWSAWAVVYQSIVKDGNAVVRFDRGGHAMTVLYEVRNE